MYLIKKLIAFINEKKVVCGKAPDGGWGWIIVIGFVVIQILITGLDRSFGLLFSRLSFLYPNASVVAIASMFPGNVYNVYVHSKVC